MVLLQEINGKQEEKKETTQRKMSVQKIEEKSESRRQSLVKQEKVIN